MPSSMFQFYAIPEETYSYICEVIKRHDLRTIVFDKLPPDPEGRWRRSPRAIDSGDITIETLGAYKEIFLYMSGHVFRDMRHDRYMAFLDDGNLDFLRIYVRWYKQWLKESNMGFRDVTDQETLKLWRKIIRDYKKTMMKGGWIFCGKSYIKDLYYSQGAKRLYDEGFEIRCGNEGSDVWLKPFEDTV